MLTENLAVFFNAAEHATAGIYTPQGGGASVNVNGIFEADYVAPLGLIQSEGPTFLYELAKTPGVMDGDEFVINGTAYLVREAKKNFGGGVGLVLVTLEEQ